MNNINFEIEVYKENGRNYVFLSHNGSSGCKYEFTDEKQLKEIVGNYVQNSYLDEKEGE